MNYFYFIILVITGVSKTNGYNICAGNENINLISNLMWRLPYRSGSSAYRVEINKKLSVGTEIKVKLDSIGTVHFGKNIATSISDLDLINNIFTFVVSEEPSVLQFVVVGKKTHQPPLISSLKINGEENCQNPDLAYFEKHPILALKRWHEAPDKSCGRRRIDQEPLPLIVHGASAKSGHWPWHAAVYKLIRDQSKYICGGTLVSKFLVLTAAHCATEQGAPVNPETLLVAFGKYSLYKTEITNQDREVFKVIVHDNFESRSLNNDIALLKLSSEAAYNNFVQPACVWVDAIYDQMTSYEITGTVVGWGIDQSDTLSKSLQEAVLPVVPDSTCIFYEPVFYTSMLNGKKFCAGNTNGTSACNGDSGGAFVVFVQDDKKSDSPAHETVGAWYVKGIVSATLTRKDANICDPNAYTVYTDVAKYRDWILNYMK